MTNPNWQYPPTEWLLKAQERLKKQFEETGEAVSDSVYVGYSDKKYYYYTIMYDGVGFNNYVSYQESKF